MLPSCYSLWYVHYGHDNNTLLLLAVHINIKWVFAVKIDMKQK